EEGLSGVKGANSVKIVGPNLEVLEQIANRALAEMAQVRGVKDLGIFRVLGQPNLNIKVDRERAARYGLNVSDVNTVVQAALGGTVAEAQERIARNIKVPTGYKIEWAGEFEGLQQAQKRLTIIVPISFILIMVLLYGLFNSLRDSLMALVGIPFAVCGGILGLYVAGLNFSISAAIGFVSLFGVSVMSGILIINGYNQVAAVGLSVMETMFRAVD